MALGIVLTPYGKIPGSFPAAITGSYGGNGVYNEPFDPQFNTRGEPGYYYDTPLGAPRLSWLDRWRLKRQARKLGLGAIPTDFDIGAAGAAAGNYTPVLSNWINAKEGFYQPPPWTPSAPGAAAPSWLPGTNRQGFYGLGNAEAPATVNDVVAQMNAHNDRVFTLGLISTAAVAVSAMITVFRTLKLIKDEKH